MKTVLRIFCSFFIMWLRSSLNSATDILKIRDGRFIRTRELSALRASY
jgi:hypothetical protein